MKPAWTTLLFLLLTVAAALAADVPWRREQAVMDSLRSVPPRLRCRWLNERGIELPGYNVPVSASDRPDSFGLVLRGKWGRGPSVEVTGRDSFVFLSLGSEVAIINSANPDNPRVLAEVQAPGLVTQAAVRDSLLYIGCASGQSGIEVWNIADPESPVFRGRTPTMLSDFCIKDTFLYVTQDLSGPNDTFKVYSIGDPANLRLLGTHRDSGACVTVVGNTAFLGDRWGLYAVDVSNPANPHQVGSWGSYIVSAEARGNICCVTQGSASQPTRLQMTILDVSNPSNMRPLGLLDSCGGYDAWLADTLVFFSGYYTGGHGFQVVSIRDSSHPAFVYCGTTPGAWGVWVDRLAARAYLADRVNGLAPVGISDPTNPAFGPRTMTAEYAVDVAVRPGLALVADDGGGLKVLDMTDPARPTQIGELDTLAYNRTLSVAVADSFAFMEWRLHPNLRSVDMTDPAHPSMAGGDTLFDYAQDMVLRDSFLYIAEDYRFQVVNVARPRQPQVVGTCNLPERSWKLVLRDTLAYVADLTALVAVNVARPDSPSIVGSWTGRALGVALLDTFAYVASSNYGLKILSIADPANPRLLDSIPLDGWVDDVEVVDSIAYVGGWRLYALSLVDPTRPQEVARWTPPSASVRRLVHSPPYLYAACTEGGVCILDTVATGIVEARGEFATPSIVVAPTVTRGLVRFNGHHGSAECRITVLDVTGREVASGTVAQDGPSDIDLTSSPDGVYLVMVNSGEGALTTKVVKTRR